MPIAALSMLSLVKKSMAEVPEVEIIAQGLREAVRGRAFGEVSVLQSAAVRFPAVPEFIAILQNRSVLDAQRKAKYLLLSLTDEFTLAIHLALWGTLKLVPALTVRAPETLICWQLDPGQELRLLDKLGYARAAAHGSHMCVLAAEKRITVRNVRTVTQHII